MTTHHVIIGGGPAATNAIESIRQFDGGRSKITLISDEPAHSRMALPYWLSGQFPREHTHTADAEHFRKLGVEARVGQRVQSIDAKGKSLTLADGSSLAFDDLLIATGASPLGLPIPGADLPGVQTLWTLEQTQALLDATQGLAKPRVVMIGAGFIGFIMLNAMYKRGWQLAVVERESHVLPRMLDADAAKLVENWLAAKGVTLHCGTTVKGITQGGAKKKAGKSKVVELADGQKLEADVVVIATGIRPNVELAKATGIEVDQGVLVNNRMQTNFSYIYAGGDVAQGPNLLGGKPEIHAIQPTAVDHGRVAGANMAGQDVTYAGSLSMNILDCCGLQCASFGNWTDAAAEKTTIANAADYIFRRLLWTGEQITGAIFIGRANDMGMLTDVGMVKGMIQTRTSMGPWKKYLEENPFDIRRAYIATKVAQQLTNTTLVGRPSKPRDYRAVDVPAKTEVGPSHGVFVGTKTY